MTAFNYLQPNVSLPSKIAHYSYSDEVVRNLHEQHLIKQQQYIVDKKDKDKDKKKKSKKDKGKKPIHEDRIIVRPKQEQPAQRFNIPPHHEYQNIIEENEKSMQLEECKTDSRNLRKFGDTEKLQEKKTRCKIEDGVYVFHNNINSVTSLTSFAEIEHKKVNHEIDMNSSGKLKNFNLSKYLNIDVKSESPCDNNDGTSKNSAEKQDNSGSSKSSSLSNKSVDSMEQAIIMSGLKNSDNQTNSYLGPFNFRKLLRPTVIAPTESLRKRKMVLPHDKSPLPDKNLKTLLNVGIPFTQF